MFKIAISSSLSRKFPRVSKNARKRDIKWGVYLRQPYWDVEELQEFVENIEDIGFHGIYTNDHLTGFEKNINGREPYLEAWTFITMVLSWSKKIHAGQTVICQSFRNPALLAKMVSSLDILSNGRFELLLGAGWKEDEYFAYGYPFPSPRVRLRQLEETIKILRALFNPNSDEWNFKGEFWNLVKCRNFPKPKTQPFPIYLGGNGPKFIRLTARVADGYNTTGTFNESLEKVNLYENELKKAKVDIEKQVKSYFGAIHIFRSDEETINYAKNRIQNDSRFKGENPKIIVHKYPWGTPEVLAGKFRQFIMDTGIECFMLKYQSSFGDDPHTIFWDLIRPLI